MIFQLLFRINHNNDTIIVSSETRDTKEELKDTVFEAAIKSYKIWHM